MRATASILLLTGLATLTMATGCQNDAAESSTNQAALTGDQTVASPIATDLALARIEGRSADHDRPGYVTFMREDRLWVFSQDSEGLAEFLDVGEPGKNATMIGAGPGGRTIKSDDTDTILGYLAAKDGFATYVDEGRVWVFEHDSEGHDQYRSVGEPGKNVTLIGAGPNRATLRSDDGATLLAYLAAKPGFKTFVDEDERIWVFENGSEGLAEYLDVGEPGKNITWIGAGPRNKTLRSDSAETLLAYVAAAPGFDVFVEDGRIWVFQAGSDGSREYQDVGEPAKSVTRIGVGPRNTTIRSDDAAVIDAYLRVLGG